MRFFGVLFFLVFSYWANAQELSVDFTHIAITVQPIPAEAKIEGSGMYTFDLRAKVDSIHIDAQKITITAFKIDDNEYAYVNTGKKISFKAPIILGEHKLYLTYYTTPTKALYFIGYDDEMVGNEQIWTQGQGKYTSNWVPSFDDMTEKVEFDLSILYDENFTVIANGKLVDSVTKNGITQWNFNMDDPMSSYLLAFAIGKYDKQQLFSKTGIRIENYYYPADSLKVEPTFRYTKEIFDFLETEIGVAYPWQNYKQVPVHDFLYAGMENTSATFFSDAYVIDSTSFIDRNYVNINAHELAHQWFGNLITEETGDHHWLQEGFATYYAYLAEKEVFGDDYFYWKLFDSAKVLNDASKKGKGESLRDPKASSLTFYEKGAWALVMLQEQIGETNFKTGIKNYLNTYQFKNVTLSDFITEMEEVSGKDLNHFEELWLRSTSFPKKEIKDFLIKHNHSIRMYYVLIHDERNSLFTKQFLEDSELSTALKLELLKQERNISDMEFLPLISVDNLNINLSSIKT
ncbi:M1 family metallopeptidase [Maribacter sp. ACAM166]|uniref:M1 family metallopeptidase n=1 Tax=Maribacter sp. ACAM166 TaxID=2508996 RepID=UPI0010FE65C9|nr:M1 family metallopeptidase [Maribacter sp. ACAM166]TLP72803.1 M1 family metallopeptidase [Maribacter sp. ACAM166]